MDTLLDALIKTAQLLLRVLPIMFFCLYGTELLSQLGVFKKLEPMGRPLARIAHLPPISAITFITGIGSLVAANTMLAAYRGNGELSDRELVLSSLLNSIPVYIREVFTYQLPVVLPLLGPWVGIIHLTTFWMSGLLKLAFVIIGGRLLPPRETGSDTDEAPDVPRPIPVTIPRQSTPFKQVLLRSFHAQKRTFVRISTLYAGINFVVLICVELGFFTWFDAMIGPMTERFGLPPLVIGPIGVYIISPMTGMTALSSLLNSHSLSNYQAILALLLGGFLMVPVVHLRYMLPKYISFFGVRLGGVIIALSIGFSLTARAIMLVAVLAIYA